MKRVIWTLAMAVAGFGLGWNSQGAVCEPGNVATATLHAACIGFGFGSNKRRARNGLCVFYWAFTLALIGATFSTSVPLAQFAAQVVVAGAAGALLGVIVGFAQLRVSGSGDRTSERPLTG
jgi:hypothetical protein